MKQANLFILLLFFTITKADTKKIIAIIAHPKKYQKHRFIFPLLAASELSINLSTFVPVLLAVLGNIHFCKPAEPEITINDSTILPKISL